MYVGGDPLFLDMHLNIEVRSLSVQSSSGENIYTFITGGQSISWSVFRQQYINQ